MHERQRIRELVVSILTTDAQDLFNLQPTVHDSPTVPYATLLGADRGLALAVYLNGDARVGEERRAQDPCTYLRESTLEIQCVTESSPIWPHAQLIDGFTEEVEAVMAKYLANNLSNTVQAFEYRETEISFAEEGEVIYPVAAIRYDVQFFTEAWEVHPDLTGIDVDYNLQEATGATYPEPPQAEDQIDDLD